MTELREALAWVVLIVLLAILAVGTVYLIANGVANHYQDKQQECLQSYFPTECHIDPIITVVGGKL